MDDIVSVFAVCSMHPVDAEHVASEGLTLYFCMPVGDFDKPTHYLSIVGCCGRSDSEFVFGVLRRYSVFSYQWITYYLLEG